MRIVIAFFLLMLLTGFSNIQDGTGDVKHIKGLFYLDGSPISVEIKNGMITEGTRIEELPEVNKNTWIAPDFSDPRPVKVGGTR